MAQAQNGRPHKLQTSRSFTRMESSPSEQSPRKRASTLQPGIKTVPEAIERTSDPLQHSMSDVFENKEDGDHSTKEEQTNDIRLPATYEELPFEVKSMTERFLDGLTAKVHPAPLSADQLSQMFQDFYERASARIATHIAALATKLDRSEPASGRSSLKGRSRAGSGAKRAESPASASGGEMLTPTEVTDRRRARRLLELKRTALEETVERCVCERLYDKLWKHRSTDDDARDEKLRSRTAALAVVGIGLKELHSDSHASSQQAREIAAEKEADINAALEPARLSLQRMDDEKYPLAKLQHLTAAHKSIVETLSAYFPSSSSADEILPTLIYSLITSPPSNINIVSNLSFVQRFRASDKVDGEAAYCLVNLEAAIAFLENVDLHSLRQDELPSGPPKSSQPQTPTTETPMREHAPIPENSPTDKSSLALPVLSKTAVTAPPRPNMSERSLSAMMQSQASKLEAGRDNFLTTADKVYDSLNGTLENSFKFVFGRFRETATGPAALPKTLDDARRLINPQNDDDDLLSGRSTPSNIDDARLWPGDERALDLIAGRKQLRDRSADSTRSGGSGKRVAFMADSSSTSIVSNRLPTPQESLGSAASFITSINPLNRFGVPSFPRFGKAPSPAPPVRSAEQSRIPSTTLEGTLPVLEKTVSHTSDAGDDLNAREALATLRTVKPPNKRFLMTSSAAELRIGDVEELLLEYKRLAKAIGDAIRS